MQTADASRIAKVSLIRLASVTHAFNQNQVFVPLTFQASAGALTVQAPSDGNVASPPGHYMLFLVDTNGVRFPSPAEDLQAPTVAITSPTPAASESGSISISASASDNQGVVGVQFQVDGVNVGAEDTASPYSISRNTTLVPNGTHTLTAVVWDAARKGAVSPGVVAVSPGVVVVVTNAADTSLPTAPTGVSAVAISTTQINVAWIASTDGAGVVGYRVLRDGVAVTTVTVTSYSDTSLESMTTYAHTVAAFD